MAQRLVQKFETFQTDFSCDKKPTTGRRDNSIFIESVGIFLTNCTSLSFKQQLKLIQGRSEQMKKTQAASVTGSRAQPPRPTSAKIQIGANVQSYRHSSLKIQFLFAFQLRVPLVGSYAQMRRFEARGQDYRGFVCHLTSVQCRRSQFLGV